MFQCSYSHFFLLWNDPREDQRSVQIPPFDAPWGSNSSVALWALSRFRISNGFHMTWKKSSQSHTNVMTFSKSNGNRLRSEALTRLKLQLRSYCLEGHRMMVFGRSSDPSLDHSIKGKNGRTSIETPPLDEFRGSSSLYAIWTLVTSGFQNSSLDF